MKMEATTVFSTTTANATAQKVLLLFSWYDYSIFAMMLGVSAVIGIYFGCFGTKQSTTGEYLLGSKTMKVAPIVVSLIASHTSGTTLLALPAEIYRYGATYWLLSLTMILIILLTAHVYLPVFYKLEITSTYEYLEMRFDGRVRNLAFLLATISRLLFLPIVIYIPALACSSATGFNVHHITPIICGICIFYTTIGGLKAVVWTDTFQFVITVGSVIAVLCLGMKATGGFLNVWNTAVEGHRLDVFDFSLDPSKRESFWAVTIGFTVHWLVITAVDQGCVQKFLAVPTLRKATLTVWLYGVGIALIKTTSVLVGLTMYAKYVDCDPFSIHAIKSSDQLLPHFVMEVAGTVPGLPGLFTVGVVSAGLSTLSANLNSSAAILYKDFISKFVPPNITEKAASNILKLIVVVTGLICVCLVFVVERLGGILPLSIALGGVALGPSFGIFSLGMLVPRANSKGAYWGAIVSLIAMAYLVFMAQYYKMTGILHQESRPLSTEGCDESVKITLHHTSANTTTTNHHEDTPMLLFRISHYYYTLMGTIISMAVGYVVSICTKEENFVRPDLVSPIVHWLLPKEKKPISELIDYNTVEKAMYLASTEKEN